VPGCNDAKEAVLIGRQCSVFAMVLVAAMASVAAGQYSDGSGTEADPWQIATPADLIALGENTHHYGDHFVMTADIDLAGQTFATAVIAPDRNPDGLDFDADAFTGTFDGGGHVIRDLVIDDGGAGNDCLGLFGWIKDGGEVRNLGLEGGSVTGTADCVGRLAGINWSGTISSCYATGAVRGTGINVGGLVGLNVDTILSCHASGSVNGDQRVGGLVGGNNGTLSSCYTTGEVGGERSIGGLVGGGSGTLSSCYATGSVNGSHEVGGLVGNSSSDVVLSCYATGSVSGGSDVGGLVGSNCSGTISSCHATGAVSGTGTDAGGLIGANLGMVSSCCATGPVIGNQSVGGLVGSNANVGTVSSSYATGLVSGYWRVGGLVGCNWSGTLSSCYATGSVIGIYDVGGLAGGDGATIWSCYFLDTAGPHNGNGTPLSDSAMRQQSSFVGFDFVGPDDGDEETWGIYDGLTYPYLVWQMFAGGDCNGNGVPDDLEIFQATVLDCNHNGIPDECEFSSRYSGGHGTASDPWQIATAQDLIDLGDTPCHYRSHFVLTADIDLAGRTFTTAVIAPDTAHAEGFQGTAFTGTFDGGGHVIRNLVIDDGGAGNDYLGLFGRIDGGEIRNLGLDDGTVSGKGYLGGLVGSSYGGTISTCYATGPVSGDDHIGGLVGSNSYGTVSSCYAIGPVSGDVYVGGLVGRSGSDTVSYCYAAGQVSGRYDYVGGLVGYGDSRVYLSFWDVHATTCSVSSGGFGRTTSQMRWAATYWGWGGGEWAIDNGSDYPHLAWENAGGEVIENVPARSYGGSGSEVDPFVIASAQDMVCMTGRVGDWDKHLVLAGDIDMASVRSYLPPLVFAGVLDGAGHVISNLTIREPGSSYVGVIGRLIDGAEVRNLGLEGGSVTGHDYVGGLVGLIDRGTLSFCYTTGPVAGNDSVGGLVGYNLFSGTISTCYSTGPVTGNDSVGGLVGYNQHGTISTCYATGMVIGDDQVGGLVGLGRGIISFCYATGAVFGDWSVGGLAGMCMGTVWSCYATGAVSGDHYVGGLVGYSNSTLGSCYATGSVVGDDDVGGLVGYDRGTTISSSCYFLDTAGPGNGFGTPLSDAAMRQQASFVGFDFVGPGDGDEEIWRIYEDLSYPYLSWQTFAGDDCNGNSVPDDLEIMRASLDCNNNEVLDECEADADGDGVIDDCDNCPETLVGWPVDASGCLSGGPVDFDKDGDVDKDDLRAFDDCANPCIVANADAGGGVNVYDLQFIKDNIFCTDDTDPVCIIADVNRDGAVNVIDLQDVKNSTFCSDDTVVVTPGCEWADFDGDGDVDHNDYRLILGCVSGADVPADPACVN